MLIADIVRRQAADTGRPNKAALVYEDQRLTYAELRVRVNRLAHALIALGVRRGDRVALLGRNSPAWVKSYFAAAACGAILVPVNFWYRSGELAYVLGDSGATVCLLAAGCASIAQPLRTGAERRRAARSGTGCGWTAGRILKRIRKPRATPRWPN